VEPPDTLEKGVRLGCGFLFGCFAGFLVVVWLLTWKAYYLLAGSLVGGVLFALAALKYGDSFWLGLSRITTVGWWRWSRWWW
jgi:hypothetical protein